MKKLWNYIDKTDLSIGAKYKCAVIAQILLYSLAGFIVWLSVNALFSPTPVYVLCFIGYPAVISVVVTFLYTCKYSFHSQT